MEASVKHFDAIVLGTGLVQSIVAGALARDNKQILHLDRNPFYGEEYAAFDPVALLTNLSNQNPGIFLSASSLGSNSPATIELDFWKSFQDLTVAFGEESRDIQDGTSLIDPSTENRPEEQSNLSEETTSEHPEKTVDPAADVTAAEDLTRFKEDHPSQYELLEKLLGPSPYSEQSSTRVLLNLFRKTRNHNLELSPSLLLSRGDTVDLLVTSNVGKYLEFKALESIWYMRDGKAERVPGTKEDVFDSPISLVDKRYLMRFLKSVGDRESWEAKEGIDTTTFVDYMSAQGLSSQLRDVIINAIAFVTDRAIAKSLTARAGLERTYQHMSSLGRWGSTAFLCGLYGTGSEICQAFCRQCAVYGGTYMLNVDINSIEEIAENSDVRFRLKLNDGTTFTSKYIVGSQDYTHLLQRKPALPRTLLHRAICILPNSRALHDGSLSLTVWPPSISNSGVIGYQTCWDVGSCPKESNILYLQSTEASAIDPILTSLNPTITIRYSHSIPTPVPPPSEATSITARPSQPFWISGPQPGISIEDAANEARQIVVDGMSAGWFASEEAGQSEEEEDLIV
ncbi:GDP dissociation inhibitor-domain-containing protein [Phlyctochytrium arcticum]|nr:GDP dissociation inhibitor-domain-containing protein [Phlyctochytrium arcticum]